MSSALWTVSKVVDMLSSGRRQWGSDVGRLMKHDPDAEREVFNSVLSKTSKNPKTHVLERLEPASDVSLDVMVM